jgi:putative transposase
VVLLHDGRVLRCAQTVPLKKGTDLSFKKGDVSIFSFDRADFRLARSRSTDDARWTFRQEVAMPRMARVVLPTYPHHVVQRGHNRQAVFADSGDFERYLATLTELKGVFGIKVYAWCLMTNHVHLLLEPSTATGLAFLMKRLAGRHALHRNRVEKRSGALWEGRYKSSLVQNDRHLLACCRYIELNPVRARIVAAAEDYPWSSCRARLGYTKSAALDLDPVYQEFGTDESTRRQRYRAFLNDAVPDGEWEMIRAAVQRGQLTASTAFAKQIATTLQRAIESRGPGRPRGPRK